MIHALLLALILLCTAGLHAQSTLQLTSQEFAQASATEKRALLRALFERKIPIDTGQLVDTIRVAAGDADARIRQQALVTLTGRSVGLLLSKDRNAMGDWIQERPAILQLRPTIERALADGDGNVRASAVAALQAIDFDGIQPLGRQLSPETASALASRYGVETFVEARRTIIQVLGGGAASSAVARQTVMAATRDPEPTIRELARRALADSGPPTPRP